MTVTAQAFNGGAAKRALSIVSDQWGVFGPTFSMKLAATPIGGDMYEIARSDWDNTIGPLFARLHDNILERTGDVNRAAAAAYGTMREDPGQIEAFHKLMCAFSAASDPARLTEYPGTPDTNPYLKDLADFVAALNGPQQAVTVSRTQLEALADAARGMMEYVREQDDESPQEQDFAARFLSTPGIRYSNGIINALM